MELLSPAGTYEKLVTAFDYGADAVYMGLKNFSMRANAGNFSDRQWEGLSALKRREGKPDRRLYCAVNVLFHEDDIVHLKEQLPLIAQWPFDAFIVTDMGAATVLKEAFPDKELHLSTQASCINATAAKVYHDLGFSRIVLGRETPLDDIRRIKDAIPELELEAFVHGAMCMAYSGRCLLSSHLTGRSGNQGDCAHTCRWNYRLMGSERLDKLLDESILGSESLALEEAERPGTYYPISEQDGFTTILSSKDLCMIDHLAELRDAGVDSLKIEGRMKSLYYVAIVTRAYRKALDALEGLPGSDQWKEFRDELFNISHREYSTGFFFGHGPVDPEMDDADDATPCSGITAAAGASPTASANEAVQPTDIPSAPGASAPTSAMSAKSASDIAPEARIGGEIDFAATPGYIRDYLFLGIVGEEARPGTFALDIRNQIRTGQRLEYIGPDVSCVADETYIPLNEYLEPVGQIDHGKTCYLSTDKPVRKGYLIRRVNEQINN